MLSGNSLTRLLAVGLFAGAQLATIEATPIAASERGGIVPLSKRAEVPLADSEGVINWGAANAHLSRTSTKYDRAADTLQRRSQGGDLVKREIHVEEDPFLSSALAEQEQVSDDEYNPLFEARAAMAFGLPLDEENDLLVRREATHTGDPNKRPTPTWSPPNAAGIIDAHKVTHPTTTSAVKKQAKGTTVHTTSTATQKKPKVATTSSKAKTTTVKAKTTSTKAKTTSTKAKVTTTTTKAKGAQTTVAATTTNTAVFTSTTAVPPVITSAQPQESASASTAGSSTTSSASAGIPSAGAESLKSYNRDLLWAGSLSIGTPAQEFLIDFDTGSADLWVPSSNCTTTACTTHNTYNSASSSSSSTVPNSKLHIQYGDGSTTDGAVFKDVVSVAGFQADQQTFGAADALASEWNTDPMDGILGMAYESISQLETPPFFQTLMSQNKVSAPQFSFALSSSTSGGTSELYLGGANSARYSGDIEWHSVASKSFWVVKGNAKVNQTAAVSNAYMIIDTGTTVVVAPPKDAKAFWAQVPGAGVYGQGYYTYPCNSPPSVSFNFGGQDWKMSESSFDLGKLSASSNRCVGSIVGQDVGMNAWIVGDKFLTNVYASFDFGKNAVGFATRK